MIATIELPNNRSEVAFILEVLKRLNVRIIEQEETVVSEEDIIEEHSVILRDRRAAMNEPDATFFTWQEAQKVLENRNKTKNTQL